MTFYLKDYKRCLDLIPKLSFEEIRKAQNVENRRSAHSIQLRDNNIIAHELR